MRVSGRVRCARATASILLLFCIHATQAFESNKYGIPIEIKVWDTGRTPLARMVDVTNGFGLKVLAEHNFLNDNNIAFSPYGLLGILVALYEGIDGDSSYQVQRAMQLPWNRNVMRIGFRDIHRTLKTYFVPEEGFLAGLALNNENVTFNEGYKEVLRFYGFDLDNNEQLPTLAPTDSTNETTTTANPSTAMPEDAPTTMPATAREETTSTPNLNAETLSDIDIRVQTTEASVSAAPSAESTTAMTPPATEVTAPQTTEVQTAAQITTTSAPTAEETTPTIAQITTTSAPTAEETTPTIAQTDTESIPAQMSSTITFTNEPVINKEVDITSVDTLTTSISTPEMSTTTETAIETTTNGVSTQTAENTASTISETETSTPASTDEPTTVASTIETLERKKKSIVDFIYSNPPYYNEAYVNEYVFHRSYDIPIPSDPVSVSPNSNFDGNQMFLVNGLRSVQVTYMQYDTVLEHAYLPHLEASALRLPLDSDRYYLLVILPTSDGASGLGRLLARMARASDLSDVCSMLRPKRVRAIVPSFTVKGHVTLTTDLQKLGIRDVFEPRQRDFTPMTRQAGVYVRSIEQAVSVAIRKYRATDASTTTNSSRYAMNQYPVPFSATYPFLYFVMDASIHVALMAGKMADPLNSRIL